MSRLGIYASQNYPRVTNSYESIQTVTLASNQPSITFSSIPSTFKHLQIRAVSAGDTNTNVRLRFNGDTATNYATHGIQAGAGYGTSVYTNSSTSATSIMLFDQQLGNSTNFNATVTDILDYTSTSKNKTIRTLNGVKGGTGGFMYFQSGLWFKTPEAVTSITIYPFTGNFYTYTTFALYGIKG